MKNIDDIIEQVRKGIKRQEMFIAQSESLLKIKPEASVEILKNIENVKRQIAELEYRILELEAKKKGETLIPQYDDGKYKSEYYKKAFDMLRVCYYDYFHQDPRFTPVPDRDMMFYDPTLFLPVSTYLVKGKIPFKVMFSENYPDYKSDNLKSVSIELPFEVLSKEENEIYLKCMLELIKMYSGEGVNLVLGNGESTNASLSFIADKDFPGYYLGRKDYYEFFNLLGDNNVRNVIYVGESMKKGVSTKDIDDVENDIIYQHKRIISDETNIPLEELNESNEKIKRRILTINRSL